MALRFMQALWPSLPTWNYRRQARFDHRPYSLKLIDFISILQFCDVMGCQIDSLILPLILCHKDLGGERGKETHFVVKFSLTKHT